MNANEASLAVQKPHATIHTEAEAVAEFRTAAPGIGQRSLFHGIEHHPRIFAEIRLQRHRADVPRNRRRASRCLAHGTGVHHPAPASQPPALSGHCRPQRRWSAQAVAREPARWSLRGVAAREDGEGGVRFIMKDEWMHFLRLPTRLSVQIS